MFVSLKESHSISLISYGGLIDEVIIRSPNKYNNTKLIEFLTENKYKMNDPRDLQKFQIQSDKDLCCLLL